MGEGGGGSYRVTQLNGQVIHCWAVIAGLCRTSVKITLLSVPSYYIRDVFLITASAEKCSGRVIYMAEKVTIKEITKFKDVH